MLNNNNEKETLRRRKIFLHGLYFDLFISTVNRKSVDPVDCCCASF